APASSFPRPTCKPPVSDRLPFIVRWKTPPNCGTVPAMDWQGEMQRRLGEMRRTGAHRSLFVSPSASLVHNDYLGLSDHPLIREAGQRALEFEGGSRGSRLLGGNRELIEVVEERIAAFFNAPSA